MLSHMLVQRIEDLGMRKNVMTIVAEKGEHFLTQLVCHIEALETCKQSKRLLVGG